jgi:hypothetical protein
MKLALVIAILAAVGSAAAQVPEWYTTHTHRGYQPEFYIIGVGAADGSNAVEKAKKEAQADIVSQIKVQVKNEMTAVTESFQLNRDETISSDFKSRSRTIVNDEITGAGIVETFVDPSTGTAYALAALDRERYCEGLRSDMNGAWTQAAGERSSAADFLKRGKFSDAIHALADARTQILAALPKKALHDAVSGKSYTPPNAATPTSLTGEMKTMISNVRIEKTRGDNQSGKVGARFAEPFAVRVLFESTAVAGAALLFESTDEVSLGDAVTDGNGEASFATHVRMLPGNALRVRMSLAGLSKEFERNLLSIAAMYSFTPHLSDQGFEIAAPELQGQPAEALKGRVASAVSTIGYRVLPVSRYRLDLSMKNDPPMKSEGFSGTLLTVKVEATVALIDKEDGAAVGTYTVKAVGGGKTEQDAVAKAAAGISVDRMKLAELLEKIEQ